jgi:hypothetical protein
MFAADGRRRRHSGISTDLRIICFRAIRWKALPSAGFIKVDFAKYGFQRT